ncbi:hypothetical protein NKH45_35310 [Mesorhizobium sp. M1156]|uniref:hypothetical protein n=1 Tax=Mesorhizobium sp. M1156 TaxID=2957064 RepID=UPI00333CE0E6
MLLRLAGWVANTIDADILKGAATVNAMAGRIEAPLVGWVPRLSAADSTELATVALRHLDLQACPRHPLRHTSATQSLNAKEE